MPCSPSMEFKGRILHRSLSKEFGMTQTGSIQFYYSLHCDRGKLGTAHSEFRKILLSLQNESEFFHLEENIRILSIIWYTYIKYNVMLFYQKAVFCHCLALYDPCGIFNQVLITSSFVMKLCITQKTTVWVFRHLSLLRQRAVNILSPFLSCLLFQHAELWDHDLCRSIALHHGVLVHHKEHALQCLLHGHDLCFCIFSFTMKVSEMILKLCSSLCLKKN